MEHSTRIWCEPHATIGWHFCFLKVSSRLLLVLGIKNCRPCSLSWVIHRQGPLHNTLCTHCTQGYLHVSNVWSSQGRRRRKLTCLLMCQKPRLKTESFSTHFANIHPCVFVLVLSLQMISKIVLSVKSSVTNRTENHKSIFTRLLMSSERRECSEGLFALETLERFWVIVHPKSVLGVLQAKTKQYATAMAIQRRLDRRLSIVRSRRKWLSITNWGKKFGNT